MSIDRNARARLLFQAEVYERRTKLKGQRGGDLQPSGVQLLRCIAFRFLNLAKNAAWPSYDTLQAATGLCRQTIADAIKRLEAAGFLIVTRRTRWEGGKLIKLSNLYVLPIEAPPLPDWESLLSRRQPEESRFLPYDQLEGPLKHALERLGAMIEQKEMLTKGAV
ncbi:MAG: helix-turn-helix domain-containing protein [Rhodopila sp.]